MPAFASKSSSIESSPLPNKPSLLNMDVEMFDTSESSATSLKDSLQMAPKSGSKVVNYNLEGKLQLRREKPQIRHLFLSLIKI